jgi:hypothetical protein
MKDKMKKESVTLAKKINLEDKRDFKRATSILRKIESCKIGSKPLKDIISKYNLDDL